MGKLVEGPPLYSLIQVSPCLASEIRKCIEKKFPGLPKTIKKLQPQDLVSLAKEEGVGFRRDILGRNLVGLKAPIEVMLTISEISSMDMFSIVKLQLEIPFFCSGEGGKLRTANQRALGIDGIANVNGCPGVAICITLGGEDTPVKIFSSKIGSNGLAREFWVAKKEIKFFSGCNVLTPDNLLRPLPKEAKP